MTEAQKKRRQRSGMTFGYIRDLLAKDLRCARSRIGFEQIALKQDLLRLRRASWALKKAILQ